MNDDEQKKRQRTQPLIIDPDDPVAYMSDCFCDGNNDWDYYMNWHRYCSESCLLFFTQFLVLTMLRLIDIGNPLCIY